MVLAVVGGRLLALLVLSLPLAQAQHAPSYQEILGLDPEASILEAQLKYVNLTNSYRPSEKQGPEARKRFARVQEAFAQFGSEDVVLQEETLSMVDYWEHVQLVDSDPALERFAELQPGGSGRLRIIFLVENAQQRHWTTFATAARLHGRVKVAQLNPSSAYGALLRSFKVKQHPAVVFFDPLSRVSKVGYSFDGVQQQAERLLRGQHGPEDYIARVQEFDPESYEWRCEGGCDWTLLFATTAAKEQQDFSSALRPFVEACKMLHYSQQAFGASSACFWLRLDRAPAWRSLLEARGADLSSGMAMGALWSGGPREGSDTKALLVVPKGTAGGTAVELQAWLSDRMKTGIDFIDSLRLPGPPPPPPPALEPWEEVAQRGSWTDLWAEVLAQLDSAGAGKLAAFWQDVQRWDQEDQTMLAGGVMLVVLGLFFLCRACCCGTSGRPTEEQALQVAPVVAVTLHKPEGERLGLTFPSGGGAALNISEVNEEGLMGKWNACQPDLERRVQPGDRIVWVSGKDAAGKVLVATSRPAMTNTLKGTGDISLGIAAKRFAQGIQCVRGTVVLKGLSLQEAIDFGPPTHSSGGDAADAIAVEVTALRPPLEAWNARQRELGSCCTQRIEVGDRIVSVNSSTDVRSGLSSKEPTVVVVRLRPQGVVRTDALDVNIERSGPEDRLGLHIRNRPGDAAEIEVLEVVDGGMVSRWNAGGGRPVFAGDRLVAVNGARDRPGMQAALQTGKATLTFQRYADDGAATGLSAAGAPAAAAGQPGWQQAPGPPSAGPAAVGGGAPLQGQPGSKQAPAAAPGVAAAPAAAGGGSWLMLLAGALAASALGVAGVAVDGMPSPHVVRMAVGGARQPMPASFRSFMVQIRPELYDSIAVLFLFAGCALTVSFFWCEISMDRKLSTLIFQIFQALFASIFLAHGSVFLLTWAGAYV